MNVVTKTDIKQLLCIITAGKAYKALEKSRTANDKSIHLSQKGVFLLFYLHDNN